MLRSLTIAALATIGLAHGNGLEAMLEARLERELMPLEEAVEPHAIDLDGSYLLAIVETPSDDRPTYEAYLARIPQIPDSAQQQPVGANDPHNVPRELATNAFDAYAEAIWIRVPDGAAFEMDERTVKIIYFEDLAHASTGLERDMYHANSGSFSAFAHHRDVYNVSSGSDR